MYQQITPEIKTEEIPYRIANTRPSDPGENFETKVDEYTCVFYGFIVA